MLRPFTFVLSVLLLAGTLTSVASVAGAEPCRPHEQPNPGCCDREPENPACCVEPTETHYQRADGSYACLDCSPDPTVPECCPSNTTWWEYKDGSHDCLPFFLVMPSPEDAEAQVGEEPVGVCDNGDWAEDFAAWASEDSSGGRPRCVSHAADAGAVTLVAYYDTRYGTFGLVVVPVAPSTPAGLRLAADTGDLSATGYSGVAMDCETCPPGGLLQADCVAYRNGECFALPDLTFAAGPVAAIL